MRSMTLQSLSRINCCCVFTCFWHKQKLNRSKTMWDKLSQHIGRVNPRINVLRFQLEYMQQTLCQLAHLIYNVTMLAPQYKITRRGNQNQERCMLVWSNKSKVRLKWMVVKLMQKLQAKHRLTITLLLRLLYACKRVKFMSLI